MAKTWQVVLATIAIFIGGLVTGAALTFGLVHWFAVHRPFIAAQFMNRSQVQQLGPQLMKSFANKLDLTDDQRAQIEPIVRRTAAQLGRDRHEVQLTSALAIERMQDEISAVLTPDQRVKFDALIAKQRERLQQFRKSRMQELQQGGDHPPAAGDSK
jgi:Spy/CpxP family protein refolding chaperone